MDNTILAVAITAIPSTITGLAAILSVTNNRKKVDILNLRVNMVQIQQRCSEKGYRTAIDTKLFYELFDMYSKTLKQNSYMCQEVEPAFKRIKLK